MSRALDKATAAALQSGDPEEAFRAIADVLTETTSATAEHLHEQERLEIEFLGHEHPPLPDGEYLLREGNAVAIPKLALVQAFIVARKKLQKHRAAISVNADNKSILRATAVILLMDPEHLTAANTRKRLIQTSLLAVDASRSALLASELHLVDSLLTSHLHRHTKSPTLWSHRRWLISCLANPAADKTRLLHDMTHVVTVAAVRHPRNYYAWEHARWLVHWQSQGGKCGSKEEEDEKLKLVVVVRDWCFRNHTDTSGWSFLFFVLASLPTSLSGVDAAPANLSPLYEETVTQVEQMATSLRWTGEAVWVFLRTAVAYHEHYRRETGTTITNIDTEQYSRFQEAVLTLLATVEPTSHEHQILTRAQEWCKAKASEKTTSTVSTASNTT
ncbi:hypothetical protein Sste5346_001911 [Sporothrix stenoceras]|uniref:Protein prenyltransferase n=1 Tax=Sporothrix stenoceras TaxID=5173 RepID=A0ABR3ZPR5_9PEZI